MNFPIFAADWVGAIVGILFLLISAASAISNAAKEKNKAQPGKTKEKAKLQKELEKFLQEAMDPEGAKQQEPRAQARNVSEPAEISFFEDDGVQAETSTPPPQRRQRQRQSRQNQAQANRKTGGNAPQAKKPKKPRLSLKERKQAESKERHKRLGGSLRAQIKQRQDKHIKPRVHGEIESNVSRHLSERFGSREDEITSLSSKRGGSQQLRELLKDRQSFRQAFILSEILSPPKARRRS